MTERRRYYYGCFARATGQAARVLQPFSSSSSALASFKSAVSKPPVNQPWILASARALRRGGHALRAVARDSSSRAVPPIWRSAGEQSQSLAQGSSELPRRWNRLASAATLL